jgi:hypothetical protein
MSAATAVMYVTKRVPARDLAGGDRINGFIADSVEHHADYAMVRWNVEGKTDGYYSYGMFVTLDRPTADTMPCPACGDPMSTKRLAEEVLAITKGMCSECVAYPRRHTIEVERERRVAAFGEGRC